ncbi:unnamed protein product [Closterium sp. NIES-54]
MDVWGPARVSGQGRERYFLLVVDDYTRYTTVFPLRSKDEVPDVLIPWIRAVRVQLRQRFGHDFLPCVYTLTEQNGIVERRIGLVMGVARTSMIHAVAPHFLWLFAVWYAAHQLNLWPRVSLPETSPTLRWTREVGDASVFWVWGSRVFVHDSSMDKLFARAIPCDVTFDESVSFYPLFPYRSAPPPPPSLFLAPSPPPVDPLLPQGPAPSSVSHVDPLLGTVPVQVAVDLGAARGTASGGTPSGDAASGGAEPGGVDSEGTGSQGAEPGGAEPGESGGAEPWGGASSVGPAGALPRLSPRPEPNSPQQLREWLVRRARLRSGAVGAKAIGGTGVGGARVTSRAGGTGGTATAGPGGARTRGSGATRTGGVGGAGAGDPTEPRVTGAGGTCSGGAEAGGAGAGGTGAGGAGAGGVGAGGTGGPGSWCPVFNRPYSSPVCLPPDYSQPPLQPASPLPACSPYTKQTDSLTERYESASCPVSPVRTTRHVPRSRPPPVPSMHAMALLPSSFPLRVHLPPPPDSSLPAVLDPESDLVRAASPIVSRLLATVVTDPSFESAAASALVAELLDFAAACRLDYATALVSESESASPPSVGGECALGTDVLEDRQEDSECLAVAVPRFASTFLAPKGNPDAPDIPTPRSYVEAITGPYSSQWQAAMDAEMAS